MARLLWNLGRRKWLPVPAPGSSVTTRWGRGERGAQEGLAFFQKSLVLLPQQKVLVLPQGDFPVEMPFLQLKMIQMLTFFFFFLS